MSDKPVDEVASLEAVWAPQVETAEALQKKLSESRMLSEQLGLLGSAVRVSGEGIAILTPAVEATGPRVAYVNDGFCQMYRSTRREVIGQTPIVFGFIEEHQSTYDSLLDHLFDQQMFEAEATARRKDGTEFELDLQLVPVIENGTLTHWVAFL